MEAYVAETMAPGLGLGADGEPRCAWCLGEALYEAYHDEEWGRPSADDTKLFEKLCLEGFQSGLSWLTVLKKRENFRRAFAGFDMATVARFGEAEVERLLADAGIIRHRGKIVSAINNAARALELQREAGSLAAFIWRFEPPAHRRPERCDHASLAALAKTDESTALSKALKARCWSFVGPTTCYAFMQAMGLVNDHFEGCPQRQEVEKARATFKRPG